MKFVTLMSTSNKPVVVNAALVRSLIDARGVGATNATRIDFDNDHFVTVVGSLDANVQALTQ
jgi:hypothetical protein